MANLIERIAHYADIDTRRAMGFLPRRLAEVPPLNLVMVEESNEYFDSIQFGNAKLYIGPLSISWVFGTDNFVSRRMYSIQRDDRLLSISTPLGVGRMWHPDFNHDGSFKRALKTV